MEIIINDTRGQSFYELNGYGDSVTISFKELKITMVKTMFCLLLVNWL